MLIKISNELYITKDEIEHIHKKDGMRNMKIKEGRGMRLKPTHKHIHTHTHTHSTHTRTHTHTHTHTHTQRERIVKNIFQSSQVF